MGQVKVSYDNNLLIPAPLPTFRKVVERSPDGGLRRRYWTVTLNGYLDARKGSPDQDGVFQKDDGYPADSPDQAADDFTGNLVGKTRGLQQLFSADGRLFELTPANGADPVTCRPRWGELTVEPGPSPGWFQLVEWGVTGECDDVNFGSYASNETVDGDSPEVEETWSLERADEVGRVHRLTHSASSSAQRTFNADGTVALQGWQVARTRVLAALGLDSTRMVAAGVLGLSSVAAYNRVRSEQVDEPGGRFTATETWTVFNPGDKPTGLSAGVAIEEWTVETAADGLTGLTRVSLSGTITGLEERDGSDTVTKSRWENAALRAAGVTDTWARNLAQTETGLSLHPKPLSTTIGRNRISGVITYQVTLDNRPASSNSAYLSEVVSYETEDAGAAIAEIPVAGRSAGPVLQDLGTSTRTALTVTVETQVGAVYGGTPAKPVYNPTALALTYLGSTPSSFYLVRSTQRWAPQSGRYSAQATFLYQ